MTSGRLEGRSFREIGVPEDISNLLEEESLQLTDLIHRNASFLRSFMDNKECAILLRVLDAAGIRMLDCSKAEYPDIELYIRKYYPVSLEELDFSQKSLKNFKQRSIECVADLQVFSRRQLLEKKIVGSHLLECIVDNLQQNRTHLRDDVFCHCISCKEEFVRAADEDNRLCPNCLARLKRVSKIKNYSVSIEGPEYSNFTDGTSGFILYATVNNNTAKPIIANLNEFGVYFGKRLWPASSYLTGYRFKEERILPWSAKTVAKIWSGNQWEEKSLPSESYIIFSVEINSKMHMFKFKKDGDEWKVNDYFPL